MADYTRLAIDCGARIVGGCCGTTPEHIRVMRQAMDSHTRRAAPDLETIVAQLGEISTGAQDQAKRGPLGDLPESEAASASGKRRRGRRRAASETPNF
jgi:5-methyltetrahydrofolate--homocysteine methyltransferase